MTGIGQLVVRYDEDSGALTRRGTHTPNGSVVVAHDDELLVAKIAGSHFYSGQGLAQAYSPASFEVYEVLREEGDGWLLVRPRLSWPVRSSGRVGQ